MEIVSANALISINATFFFQLVSFLLFMFILNKIMVKPLRKINAKRDNYISAIQEKIDYSKEQANAMLLEFEKKRIDVIKESLLETNEMEDKAKVRSLEIYTKARSEVAALRKISEEDINRHTAELRAVLDSNINDIIKLVTGKIFENRRLIK